MDVTFTTKQRLFPLISYAPLFYLLFLLSFYPFYKAIINNSYIVQVVMLTTSLTNHLCSRMLLI